MTAVAVEASLRAVAAPFEGGTAGGGASGDGRASGGPAGGAVELRWGPVFASLGRRDDDEYVEALELIYEGYLLHYRTGRLGIVSGDDPQTALLAGDVFYARGLDLIAVRGDVASVALLARLMSACSCLRGLAAPFSDDDAVWAYTVAALAALRAGRPAERAGAFFDELDAMLAEGAPVDVPRRAAAAAAALGLPDPAPLAAAFALPDPPADPR